MLFIGVVSFALAVLTTIHGAAVPVARVAPIPSLLDISIQELTDLLDSGVITSYELVSLYLKRIGQVNDELNAVLELSKEALTIARQRDKERISGFNRGLLHGIPILVKDNFATTDDMLTGAGSVCLAKSRPSKEATVVAKLRKAGAIIIGKTNMSEFASGRGNVTEGWSARGNQTFGAYVEHQTACGSSSGSGVAASLGLAAGTLGTETAGSITCPAFVNNVVGIKPTVGLTSRFGVVPLTARQDTTGPIAQCVADAALMLEVIASKDQNDNYTLLQPWDTPPSYRKALNASALQGKRLGAVFMRENRLIDELFVNAHQIDRVLRDAVSELEAAGANVVEVKLGIDGIPLRNSTQELGVKMSMYGVPDFAEGMKAYMESLVPDDKTPHTLSELLECMETDPDEFGSSVDFSGIRQIAQTNKTSGSIESWDAYSDAKGESRDMIFSPMKELGLDALVMLIDTAIIFTAASGLPIVTVPMGMLGDDASTVWDKHGKVIEEAPGFPLGLSFVADQWTEHELIGYAYAYEQASQKRRKMQPYIKFDLDLDSIIQETSKLDL